MKREDRESQKLKKLDKAFVSLFVKEDPVTMFRFGLYQQAAKVPNGKIDHDLKFLKMLKQLYKEYEGIKSKLLPSKKALDVEVTIHFLKRRLFELEELHLNNHRPQTMQVVAESLSQIVLRTYLPLDKRMRAMTERFQQLNKYIKQTMTRPIQPVTSFIEVELEYLTYIPGFFHDLVELARENLKMTPFNTFFRANEQLQNTLEHYTNWLIIDVFPHCTHQLPISPKTYATYLKLLDIKDSPSKIYKHAEAQIKKHRSKLKTLTRKIKKRSSIEEVRESIRSKYPASQEDVIKFATASINESKEFVLRSSFATMPENDTLYVINTPHYLRHLHPFTAYLPPAPFDETVYGYFSITPGNSDNNKLKEHNNSFIHNSTVAHGYPGRHLMAVCAQTHSNPIRFIAHSPVLTEGWSHYCEERVKEIGYNDSPEHLFTMTLEMIRHEIHVLIDIGLYTEKMTIEEAVQLISKEIGMDPYSAHSEVMHIALHPGYAVCALYGKERIKEIKKYAKTKMKSKFTETFIHDVLLYAGALPFTLMKKELDMKIAAALKKGKK